MDRAQDGAKATGLVRQVWRVESAHPQQCSLGLVNEPYDDYRLMHLGGSCSVSGHQDTARLRARVAEAVWLCEATHCHCHSGQAAMNVLPLPSGQACPPPVSPGVLAPAAGVSPRLAPAGRGLPSLDVHLIGRGAILHLTLAGGACGAEKQKSTAVNREERLGETNLGAACLPLRVPRGDFSSRSTPLATPGPHRILSLVPSPFLLVCPSEPIKALFLAASMACGSSGLGIEPVP